MSITRILLGAVLAFTALQASAQVVRCKGADGKVTYSDAPCPQGAEGKSVYTQGNVVDGSEDRGAAARNNANAAQNARSRELDALVSNAPQQCRFKHFSLGDNRGKLLAENAKRECVQNILNEKNGLPISDRNYRMWRDHYDSERASRDQSVTQSQIQQLQNERRPLKCSPDGLGGATCR